MTLLRCLPLLPCPPSLSICLSLCVLLSLSLVMALFSSAFCSGCLSMRPASPSPSSLPRVVHCVYYLLSLARTTIQLTAPEQLFILLNPLECPRHCWRFLLLLLLLLLVILCALLVLGVCGRSLCLVCASDLLPCGSRQKEQQKQRHRNRNCPTKRRRHNCAGRKRCNLFISTKLIYLNCIVID